MKQFTKSFTQQEAIPESAIEEAVEVLRTGRLHRYNAADGEQTHTELLEVEFAEYLGVPLLFSGNFRRLCVTNSNASSRS